MRFKRLLAIGALSAMAATTLLSFGGAAHAAVPTISFLSPVVGATYDAGVGASTVSWISKDAPARSYVRNDLELCNTAGTSCRQIYLESTPRTAPGGVFCNPSATIVAPCTNGVPRNSQSVRFRFDDGTNGPTDNNVAAGSYTLKVKLRANNNAVLATTLSPVFTITLPAPMCPCSLWDTATAVPGTAAANDPQPVELGMKFIPSVNGYVSCIQFFKGATNTGAHVGHLWTASGTLLGTATFAGESASGWQVAGLDGGPVPVAAGQTYVVSYYAPNGNYAFDANYFNVARTVGPLTAPDSASSGGNGVYRYGAGGGFPTNTFNAANYWVDVTFEV